MPKRRRWSTGKRLAYGLGTGMSDALQVLMRDTLNQRSADRVAERQAEQDARIAERQGALQQQGQQFQARQSALSELPKLVSELGPEAALAMLDARGTELFPPTTPEDEVGTGERQMEQEAGRAATHSLVESMRPPLRRKLESTVGASIGSATSPEQLGESDIMGQILAADPRAVPGESEPGMRVGGLRPEAYEYVARAEDKAEALRNKPTDTVTGTDPVTGQGFSRLVSPTQHAQGIATSPTPTQAGTFAGQQETATINAAGPARTRQAGAEGYARANAEIKARLDNKKAILDMELEKAKGELLLIGDKVAMTKSAERIQDAHDTATKMLPAATQLQTLWLEAVPQIRSMGAGMFGRAGLGAAEWLQPDSTLPPGVKRYNDFVNAVRPMLARAFGQTGNPALMEQEWARYVPNYSEALTPDTALEKLARLEALGSSAIDLAKAAAQGPLTAEQVDAILQPKVDEALAELQQRARQMAVPPTERVDPRSGLRFRVTPNGMELVR